MSPQYEPGGSGQRCNIFVEGTVDESGRIVYRAVHLQSGVSAAIRDYPSEHNPSTFEAKKAYVIAALQQKLTVAGR